MITLIMLCVTYAAFKEDNRHVSCLAKTARREIITEAGSSGTVTTALGEPAKENKKHTALSPSSSPQTTTTNQQQQQQAKPLTAADDGCGSVTAADEGCGDGG